MLKSREKVRHTQIKELEKYLESSDELEDDLVSIEDARMSGTCEWFVRKESYQKWSDFASEAPNVLWVNGRPAAVKSVLAGYVVSQLRKYNANCSCLFFKHGDKSKSRFSACLRFLVFQMACTNIRVRDVFLEVQKEGVKLDNGTERNLWRNLFLCGIF